MVRSEITARFVDDTRESLLGQLLELAEKREDDVAWIVKNLVHQKPNVLKEALLATSATQLARAATERLSPRAGPCPDVIKEESTKPMTSGMSTAHMTREGSLDSGQFGLTLTDISKDRKRHEELPSPSSSQGTASSRSALVGSPRSEGSPQRPSMSAHISQNSARAILGWTPPESETYEEDSEDLVKVERGPVRTLSRLTSSGLARCTGRSSVEAEVAVQFSAAMYFAMPNESSVHLEVLRIGVLANVSMVKFSTLDGSAKAGSTYEATSGVLTFEPGITSMEIEVPLIEATRWSGVLEFEVLLRKEGLVGAALGQHMCKARVQILRSPTTFPTQSIQMLHQKRFYKRYPQAGKFCEYLRFCWKDHQVWRNSMKIIAGDQLCNLIFIFMLPLGVCLLDLFQPDSCDPLGLADNREWFLLGVAAYVLLQAAVRHCIGWGRLRWGVAASDLAALEMGFVRMFLSYSEHVRCQLVVGEVVGTMTDAMPDLVTKGFLNAHLVVQFTGQLFYLMAFQVVMPYIFVQPLRPQAIVLLVVFPPVMLAFCLLRGATTDRVIQARYDERLGLTNYGHSMWHDYQRIADFSRQPSVKDNFQELFAARARATSAVAQVITNNRMFGQWLTFLLLALHIWLNGRELIARNITFVTFLADTVVVAMYGGVCWNIYRVILEIHSVMPQLDNIIKLMNTHNTVQARMKLNRHRRRKLQLMRAALQMDDMLGLHLDELPILIENVNFTYSGRSICSKRFSWAGRMEIVQGELVSIIGPRGEGKATLLKIIGEVLRSEKIGKKETIFVPTHLQVLHVMNREIHFRGCLYDILTFGVGQGSKDGNKDRVIRICEQLGLPENVLALMDSTECLAWDQILSRTQCALLNLACALVANPEVLCVHKPTETLDEISARRVLELLRYFVDNKGVGQDPMTAHLRKPRTCIFTSTRLLAVDQSDQVYHVSTSRGMRRVDKEDVTIDMLS